MGLGVGVCAVVPRQTTVTAYFSSEQLLLFYLDCTATPIDWGQSRSY